MKTRPYAHVLDFRSQKEIDDEDLPALRKFVKEFIRREANIQIRLASGRRPDIGMAKNILNDLVNTAKTLV